MAEQKRSTLVQTSFSPPQVCAVVNRFLLSQVESVFATGTTELGSAAHFWHVPMLYILLTSSGMKLAKRRSAPSPGRFNSIR